ncbi:MAG: hypothetical protein A2145_05800 [candidate division Zixibacteria bacterium RBG_16_40_9]|nr:MAG: hypothetical protein A2145_05800 [candidate division Zixibacteria bacterium RBG_16_40_9]
MKKKIFLSSLLVVSIFFRLSHSIEKLSLTPSDIKKEYGKAVVLIATLKEQEESVGLGSGFIVDQEGVIVTNYHVIQGAYPAVVKLLNGDIYKEISIVDFDSTRDIAIIKVKGWGLPMVKLGNSDSIDIGERIVVIGNPKGLENTVSDGLLSGIRETGKGYKLHQLTAPVSAGSSGSPVFNSKGQVIGIATSTIIDGQNLNFSVPINYVRGLISKTSKMTLEEFSKLPYYEQTPTSFYSAKILDIKEFLRSFNETVAKFYSSVDNLISGFALTSEPHRKKFRASQFYIDSGIYFAKEQLNDVRDKINKISCNDTLGLDILKEYRYAVSKTTEGLNLILDGLRDKNRGYPNWDKCNEGLVKVSLMLDDLETRANKKHLSLVDTQYPELKDSLLPFMTADSLKKGSAYVGFKYAYAQKDITITWLGENVPRGKTGLAIGDKILGVDTVITFSDIRDYTTFMNDIEPGTRVKFLIERNGEELFIIIKTAKRP